MKFHSSPCHLFGFKGPHPKACLALLLLAAFGISNLHAATSIAETLSAEQRAKLHDGNTVVVATEIPRTPWPELTLYRLVNAKPEEVYELFKDYESAPSYTPGMLKAEVVATPEQSTKDVRYTVRLPVLGNVSYIVRNYYSKLSNGYQVRWELVESPIASASNGSLTIEPYGEKTLLRYQNHVTPSVPMAGMLKAQARKEAETTIEAIAREAERRSSLASNGSARN